MTTAKYKQKPLDNLYKKGKPKLQPSSTTNPAQNAEAGITWLGIPMALPTVLGASTPNDDLVAMSMDTYSKMKVPTKNVGSQMTQQPTSPFSLFNSWVNTPSLSKMQAELNSFGQTTMNNLSSPTTEQTEPLDVSKPVTLTVKGQLKPNILTKVPRQKSSPSSKPKMKPSPVGW